LGFGLIRFVLNFFSIRLSLAYSVVINQWFYWAYGVVDEWQMKSGVNSAFSTVAGMLP
jgi:hypothetical protein